MALPSFAMKGAEQWRGNYRQSNIKGTFLFFFFKKMSDSTVCLYTAGNETKRKGKAIMKEEGKGEVVATMCS